jgi:formate dehydrogenase iron-sulfur subunit
MEPACAQACPTDSIQFGELDELRERAAERVEVLHQRGRSEARLYGEDPEDGVGGFGAFFLLLDEPETYRLPPAPVVPTRHAGTVWKSALVAAAAMTAGIAASLLGGRR